MKNTVRLTALALCAALCGCNTAPVQTEIITSETAPVTSVSATTAAAAAGETVISAEKSAEEDKREVLHFTSEPERSAENKYVEITAGTKFYECRYSQENVLKSREDFGNKELLEEAEEFLLNSKFAENAIRTYFDFFPEEIKSCGISYEFSSGLTLDFDSNGAEESFLLFGAEWGEQTLDPIWRGGFLVFADSSGALTLLNETIGDNYGIFPCGEIYELKYNGFSHFVLDGGHSNSSSMAVWYSVNGNTAKLELREFHHYLINDGFALCISSVQTVNSWLVFWNEDAKCYVTPEPEYFSMEDSAKIIEKLPLSREIKKEIRGETVGIIGKKFYFFKEDIPAVRSFIYQDGVFKEFMTYPWDGEYGFSLKDRRNEFIDYFPIPYAVNFDYDTAVRNIAAVDET